MRERRLSNNQTGKMLFTKLLELFLSKADIELLGRLVTDKWRDFAPRYAVAFIFMAIVAGTTALSAWLMKDVINLIFVERNSGAMYWLPAVVIAIYVAKGAASYFQEVILARIGNRMVAETQRKMFAGLLLQDMAFYSRHPSSELIARLTHNAQATREALNIVATGLGRDLLTLVGLVAVMLIQQPQMFGICAITAPIGLFIQRKFVKRVQKVSRKELLSFGDVVNTMRETAQGIRVVKAFTLEKALHERMNRAVAKVEERANKITAINARTNPLVDTLGGFAVAAAIFYAGWRSVAFGDTPGEFFSFITAMLLAYEPARRLGRLQVKLGRLVSAYG